jgi:hypothetical protein
MDIERLRTVRPSYIVGGGLVILMTCFVMFACLALIWTTSRNAEGDRIATEVAEDRQTRQSPRVTVDANAGTPATAESGTPNPLPTRTLVGLPTTLPTAGGIPPTSDSSTVPIGDGGSFGGTNLPAPDEAVRNYYTLVDANRYDATWPMLTDAFKQKFNCCAPNYDFAGYMQWWESVDRVEFGRVETISQSGDRATVFVELTYVMKAGTRSNDGGSYFDLLYDATTGQWLLDDRRDF